MQGQEKERKKEEKGVHAGEGNYTSSLELKRFKLHLNQNLFHSSAFACSAFVYFSDSLLESSSILIKPNNAIEGTQLKNGKGEKILFRNSS